MHVTPDLSYDHEEGARKKGEYNITGGNMYTEKNGM